MKIEGLTALVYASPRPDVLADFYRTHLGIPFEHERHGPIQDHLEAWFAGVHFAIRKGASEGAGPLAPTFRVTDLDACLANFRAHGLPPLHDVAELGEGKRLVSYRDPDGNVFRLMEFGEA